MTQEYRVLLYYHYVPIENGALFAQQHLADCKALGLKGRILIADEGINGTLSGTIEQTDAYIRLLKSDSRFASTVFKIDETDQHAFKKMHVRYRAELVNLNLENDIDPLKLTGTYLTPTEFRQGLLDENTIVIDARNDYEFDLGHFRGAIRPDIKNFRDLPQWVQDHKEEFMEKRILTYCTGGIRCEKFSGWLVREGFKDVGQLHGGIATYGKDSEVQGDLWDGQMYVFDSRIAVPINQKEKVIVGRDWFDGTPCERYINCANPECNRQLLASEENEAQYLGACSYECRIHPKNRYIQSHHLSTDEINARLEHKKAF
ncbi:oxygen-dependent tRNA uridine(34) hydroxylase TrhO [Lactococcus kimchii]|uniref:oxygen-dependent tRNA uridine(34) hydroxylase TrhO n=1 Tax=Lactococcus sp. S-13 TaxID=2507158 RepID=UPI001022BCA8|nr:rhodanese-related sulfurtransferase [Lactococcus sp. S-13]RZI48222.1 rhodanese-related sulfurtransferase [Lactococcus sp. S-13]